MRAASWARLLFLASAYVALSSWIGLNTTPLFRGELEGRVAFFLDVWGDSLLADAVFVAGTLLAGLIVVALVARGWKWVAALVGLVSHWIVYAASYVSLDQMQHPQTRTLGEAFAFVAEWGWPGLIFAASAPVVYLAWRSRCGRWIESDHEIRFEPSRG